MINKYLLIIPCSKRKNNSIEGKLPALFLYDGPFYRIVRKFFREYGIPTNLDIVIISAKYGLITTSTMVPYYDTRMTKEIIHNFADELKTRLIDIINGDNYIEIFQNIGGNYYEVVKGWEKNIDKNVNITTTEGGIGKRSKEMREWLVMRFIKR